MFKSLYSLLTPSGVGGSSSSQDQTQDIVFIKRISGDELIEVELNRGDSSKPRMDLDAFKEVSASKLNLIKRSVQIYEANGSNLILSDSHFQSAVANGKQHATAAVFVCDGDVDLLSSTVGGVVDEPPVGASVLKEGGGIQTVQGLSSSETTVESNKWTVSVDHQELKKRTKIQVDASITFNEFKNKISTNMRLDPASVTIFYMESEYQVDVTDEE
ncbi:hypothetical protein HDU76_013072 [Blyttiomyces sp. JEL0837]|nr:hypothetical protein HDU76_013072 [Blyttiomyces sp. JEL0837]